MTATNLQPSAGRPRRASLHLASDLLSEAGRRMLFTLRRWRDASAAATNSRGSTSVRSPISG